MALLLVLQQLVSVVLSLAVLYRRGASWLLPAILLVHGIPQRNRRLRSHLGNLQAVAHKPSRCRTAEPDGAPDPVVCDYSQGGHRRIRTRPALRARSAADRDVGVVWILSDSRRTKPQRIDFRVWAFHRHDHNKYRHSISAWK